ncbi:ComEA family DNA-binding protein [Leucobacter allii]|uniref:ComEA family DNA-binding protein n=1 Tax=Leucobacter allii TaxID=2932247 RepID=A0ABY4FRC5_9MICO|nr:ComEA family DNA-binding protein [Leucobacter allii]UOQ58724.1 ComEA family DNA-binding protein [Leucobacter allii]
MDATLPSTDPAAPGDPGDPRHGMPDDAPHWRSEEVLARPSWRERARGRPDVRRLSTLEELPLGRRIARATGTPLLAGLVAFACAVAIAIALSVLGARPAAIAAGELAPATPAQEAGTDQAGGDPAATDSTADPPASAERADAGRTGAADLLVHVVGEVGRPGIVELPPGSRVADALEAAEGATPAAALESVNLARVLVDGEQLVVPDAELAASWAAGAGTGAPGNAAAAAGSASAVEGPGVPPAGSAASNAAGIVPLNTADAAALETLPRIGPALAQRIIAWRDAHGAFTSVDQLLDVPGIGAKTLDGLRDAVSAP